MQAIVRALMLDASRVLGTAACPFYSHFVLVDLGGGHDFAPLAQELRAATGLKTRVHTAHVSWAVIVTQTLFFEVKGKRVLGLAVLETDVSVNHVRWLNCLLDRPFLKRLDVLLCVTTPPPWTMLKYLHRSYVSLTPPRPEGHLVFASEYNDFPKNRRPEYVSRGLDGFAPLDSELGQRYLGTQAAPDPARQDTLPLFRRRS